jgi:hypothetical protein
MDEFEKRVIRILATRGLGLDDVATQATSRSQLQTALARLLMRDEVVCNERLEPCLPTGDATGSLEDQIVRHVAEYGPISPGGLVRDLRHTFTEAQVRRWMQLLVERRTLLFDENMFLALPKLKSHATRASKTG